MITAINNGADTTPPKPATTPEKTIGDPLANEQTFLKLFVAQLQNQNPMQPQDGIQFISQLAEFSSLEQSVQMRQDLDAILKNLAALQPGGTPPTKP